MEKKKVGQIAATAISKAGSAFEILFMLIIVFGWVFVAIGAFMAFLMIAEVPFEELLTGSSWWGKAYAFCSAGTFVICLAVGIVYVVKLRREVWDWMVGDDVPALPSKLLYIPKFCIWSILLGFVFIFGTIVFWPILWGYVLLHLKDKIESLFWK